MTKTEEQFRRQMNKGLVISLVGFVISISPLLLNPISPITVPIFIVMIGYLVGAIGIVIYLQAFIRGLRYAQSKKYNQDLRLKQPWE